VSLPGDGEESPRRFDDILAELEKTIAVLADGSAPLDDLVAAHQRALRLLTDAESRLSELRARADDTAQLLSE
jgi:exodeoxyribonuclease VII small subunit